LGVGALPFAGLTRQVHLIARAEELGHLPDDLARDCRRLVRDRPVPRFADVAPDLSAAIKIAADPGPGTGPWDGTVSAAGCRSVCTDDIRMLYGMNTG